MFGKKTTENSKMEVFQKSIERNIRAVSLNSIQQSLCPLLSTMR